MSGEGIRLEKSYVHTKCIFQEMSGEGIRLEKSYVHTKCSPSRAALMTGRYAWR